MLAATHKKLAPLHELRVWSRRVFSGRRAQEQVEKPNVVMAEEWQQARNALLQAEEENPPALSG